LFQYKASKRKRPSGFRLPVVLNDEERKALLAAPDQSKPLGLRNYCMIKIFLNSGLRVSEALNLKVDDIDWETGRLFVRAGKGNRDRILFLKEDDMELYRRWLKARPADSEYLFCTLKGTRMGDRNVRYFIKNYARQVNIKKDVHPHALRHSFATDMLQNTKNIRLVQKALGHTSIATTMIYTHISDEELELALKGFRV